MSLVNQPAILSGAFAAEGDKNTIPANNDGLSGLASIAKGFPPITQVPLVQGGQPPQRQDFNGILNLFSQFLLYAQNGGVYAYNNTLDYQPPAIIASDNVFYQCVAENGPSTSAGIQPVTNTDYWEKLVPDVAVMTGASSGSAGTSGLVPAPTQGQQKNFLTGAGVWQAIATTEQAQAGIDDSAPMTALKVAQAITAQVSTVPTGTILPFAGNTIPEGFLDCNGAGISASTYSDLYAVIGNTYGGNSTTFNLPNLTNRFLQGSNTAGTVKAAGLPNITGKWINGNIADAGGWLGNNGAIYQISASGGFAGSDGWKAQATIGIDASRVSAVYGARNTVHPPAVTGRFIIKY